MLNKDVLEDLCPLIQQVGKDVPTFLLVSIAYCEEMVTTVYHNNSKLVGKSF